MVIMVSSVCDNVAILSTGCVLSVRQLIGPMSCYINTIGRFTRYKSKYAENTIAAFQGAIDAGAKCIETGECSSTFSASFLNRGFLLEYDYGLTNDVFRRSIEW